jgi:hypothetical protein
MKVLLSPAKKLDYSNAQTGSELNLALGDKTEQLIGVLKKYSNKKLGKLMNLSPSLSQLNYDRYQNFETAEIKEAALAFNGEVYSGLQAEEWNQKQRAFANKHVRILSGLYGVVKPLDPIKPYRLEMGTSLKVGRKKNLYEFWGDSVTEVLLSEMTSEEPIINLASNEYAKVIDWKKVKQPVITPAFKEFKNGDFKTIMVFAKKARGFMANYIVQNELTDTESLKGFNVEGYEYNENLSKGNNWVFTR